MPQQLDDQLRQYYLSHGATATEFGANGINSRFVSLRLSEEVIAESADADSGLGAVVMLARNTANNELVFLGMLVIGVLGFTFDVLLRYVQRRMLYWVPEEQAALKT